MSVQQNGGVLYELLLTDKSADKLGYRGSLNIAGEPFAIEVAVLTSGTGADGLSVEPSCPTAPDAARKVLERTAGIMVRSAVRGARKNKLPPPRRVRRWRPLPRQLSAAVRPADVAVSPPKPGA